MLALINVEDTLKNYKPFLEWKNIPELVHFLTKWHYTIAKIHQEKANFVTHIVIKVLKESMWNKLQEQLQELSF